MLLFRVFGLATVLLFLCNQLSGQIYFEDQFSEINMSTYTYTISETDTLKMDVFIPEDNVSADKPVVLYVHGGGFAGGQRDLPNHHTFCEKKKKKGYVAITMSYSLLMKGKSFSCDQPAPNKQTTFFKTAREISLASQFIADHESEWGISPEKIVLAGSSAGAEAVIHNAYWKKTRQGILSPDFQYAGVISMAGALSNLNWVIDSTAIPTQLFHGTCDNLVPYGEAPHHYCEADEPGYIMLYGSFSIAEKLRETGSSFYLVTGCNDGHEWNELPLHSHFHYVVAFLSHDTLQGELTQIHPVEKHDDQKNNCKNKDHYQFCVN